MHVGFVGLILGKEMLLHTFETQIYKFLLNKTAVQHEDFAGHRIPKTFIIVVTLITNVTVSTFTFFKEFLTFCAIKDTFDTALLEVRHYCVCRVAQTPMSFSPICNLVIWLAASFVLLVSNHDLVPSFSALIHDCFGWFISP
jgi:hypothetical protein